MKKQTLVLTILLMSAFFGGFAQPVIYTKAPNGVTTTQVRAPNGLSTYAYLRACALVLQSELTGISVTNNTITSFGFTLSAGTNTPTTGNFTVYLQNTTDVSYTKGTTWSTITTGMTQVYASTMTVPGSAGTTSVALTLSTPFVYSGGGIYVAYDWYSAGPYASTPATYYAEGSVLVPGCASANSASSPPATLGTTAFRPDYLFGVTNTYTNEISVVGMEATGRIAGTVSNSNSITAIVQNNGGTAKTNIPVTLNITGANTFANTQTVSSLASGASTTLTFAGFTPLLAGLNTISVSVPSDELNANNSQVYTQSVTCNEWAINPANVSYTTGSVGFNTGSGIIAATYTNPVTSTLTGIKASISTVTTSIGNALWGALLNSTGSVIATTNTVTITNAMLGTPVSFSLTTPQALGAGSVYYLGIAQPANSSTGYFPMGTYTTAYVPFMKYVTTTTVGGTPTPLTSNLGYMDIVGVFQSTYNAAVNSPTVVCGSQAVLIASGGSTYTWSTGPANSNYSVTPLASTVYTVNSNNSFGCTDTRTAMVSVNPITVTASSSSPSVCAGGSVNISGGGASTYTWSGASSATTASFASVPSTTSTYSVIGANSAGCTNSANVTVVVNANPTLTASSQTVVCGTAATLVANTSNGTYTWTSGPANTNYVVTPTLSTTYSVNGTSTAGCVTSKTVAVTVTPLTVTAVSSASAICEGDTITITGSGASLYFWSAGSSTASASFTDSPSTTTTYSLAGANLAGCTSTAAVSVIVNANPTITVNSGSICAGQIFTLNASGANSYTYSSGSNTVSPLVNTSYSVSGSNAAGCTSSLVVSNVTVNINPTVTANSGTICAGNVFTINASGASTYTYSGGSNTVSPATTASYTVTGSSSEGCVSNAATSTVTVNANPTVTAVSDRTLICSGESVILTASGAVNYVWSTASSSAGIVVSPSISTSYTVEGTDANGCKATVVITQSVDACTGINSNSLNQALDIISIYPNPNNGLFYIELSSTASVTVLNALGAVVFTQNLPADKNLIDMNQFNKGVYFVIINMNGKNRSVKLIKD